MAEGYAGLGWAGQRAGLNKLGWAHFNRLGWVLGWAEGWAGQRAGLGEGWVLGWSVTWKAGQPGAGLAGCWRDLGWERDAKRGPGEHSDKSSKKFNNLII